MYMRKISVKAQKLFSLIFITIEQNLYNEITCYQAKETLHKMGCMKTWHQSLMEGSKEVLFMVQKS